MENTKDFFRRFSEKMKSLSMNEYLILALVTSVFISVYLLAALILLLPLYFVLTHQTEKALPKEKHEYALLIFSFLAMITTFSFSTDATAGNTTIKAFWLKLLSIGIVVLVFDIIFFSNIMTKRAFRMGLILSSVLSVTSFLIAVIQRILEIYPDPINRPGRVASIFFNENYYSTVIEFVIVISLYLLFSSAKKKNAILFGVIIIINVIGLYLCQCRSAYVAVAATVTVYIFLHFKKKRYSLLSFGLIAVCLLLITCLDHFGSDVFKRLDAETILNDFDFRLGIWKTALESIKTNPLFGRGYYSYAAVMNEVAGETKYVAIHAHNLIIEIVMNFGLVGTAFFMTYCVTSVAKCLKACFSMRNRTTFALVLSAALTIVIHGMLDITIFFPQTGFFAVFLLTCPQIYDEEKTNQG